MQNHKSEILQFSEFKNSTADIKENLNKLNSKESLDTFSLVSMKNYSGDDQDFERQLIEVFLQDVPEYLRQLDCEISNENYEEIGKTAHKLKSPMGIFGFNILKSNFEKIHQFSLKSQIIPIVELVAISKDNIGKIITELREFLDNLL